jgi:YHS domain-containing protein
MAISIDPVCKMVVDESKCKTTSEYNGKKYYSAARGASGLLTRTRRNT